MSGMHSLNHSVLPVRDMDVAAAFYCDVLGATSFNYTTFEIGGIKTGSALFRSFIIGDFLVALTVARNALEMPPDDQFRGAQGFRHGFQVTRSEFGDILDSLKTHDIAFQGPVDHPEAGPFGQSVYFKDPSGNFLEFIWRRDEDALPKDREYLSPE